MTEPQVGEKQSQDGGRAEVSGESGSGAGGSVEMVVEVTGGSGKTDEEGETVDLGETGEVSEAGEFSGELLEAGGVTGELCEGGAAAGAEVSGWMPTPARRCSKRKNVVNAVGGGKAGRLEEGADTCQSGKQTVPCKNQSRDF